MESGKIIVVANQKGGVAKTSTVRNLSYALAEMGKKVLVVDFDPQYNLTTSFGVLPTQAPYNTGTLITNLLLDESLPDTNEFIQKIGSVDLIPSSRSLTVAEANLLMTPDSNDYLAALLNPLRLSYDYIIVDTNPSLGSLTINALTAADEVIMPEIYPAREQPIPGVDSGLIMKDVKCESKRLIERKDLLNLIKNSNFDILMTLGAADIDRLLPDIQHILKGKITPVGEGA